MFVISLTKNALLYNFPYITFRFLYLACFEDISWIQLYIKKVSSSLSEYNKKHYIYVERLDYFTTNHLLKFFFFFFFFFASNSRFCFSHWYESIAIQSNTQDLTNVCDQSAIHWTVKYYCNIHNRHRPLIAHCSLLIAHYLVSHSSYARTQFNFFCILFNHSIYLGLCTVIRKRHTTHSSLFCNHTPYYFLRFEYYWCMSFSTRCWSFWIWTKNDTLQHCLSDISLHRQIRFFQ